MSQQELLGHVVQVLANTGIEYMLTGSMASSLQGEPRSSHDIDLVVALSLERAKALIRAFPPPDYYLSDTAVHEALRHRTTFNLLRLTDGEKVDFWILKDEPFDRSRFTRKRVEQVAGIQINVSAPEDTILVKLHWAKECGGSEKQSIDALRVYEVQRKHLDLNYLDHWASELGIEELWQQVQAEAEPL